MYVQNCKSSIQRKSPPCLKTQLAKVKIIQSPPFVSPPLFFSLKRHVAGKLILSFLCQLQICIYMNKWANVIVFMLIRICSEVISAFEQCARPEAMSRPMFETLQLHKCGAQICAALCIRVFECMHTLYLCVCLHVFVLLYLCTAWGFTASWVWCASGQQ